MWSCKEISLLASKALDSRLSWRERWAVRLHLVYCRGCREFGRQIEFLRRMARRPEAPTTSDVRLSQDARNRIQANLQGER